MVRNRWGMLAAAILILVAGVWTYSGTAAQAATDAHHAKTAVVTPAQALARLMAGNQRFQDGEMTYPAQDTRRREALTGSQSPFAVILSCSDSRIPPAIIFDQGLGHLFVVRVAGNTVTRAGLESIDYAVDHLGANLIMVLGHDNCGAVKGALKECPMPGKKSKDGLAEIFSNICPAVDKARKTGGDVFSRAINLNVDDQVAMLKHSPQFEKRVRNGSLMIVGARYELRTGKVRLLSPRN